MAKLCPNCGHQNDDGVKFCINCGARTDGQPDTRHDPSQPQSGYPSYPPYSAQPPKKKTGFLIGVIAAVLFMTSIAVVVILANSPKKPDKTPEPTYAEGYYPQADDNSLDPSALEYGDEHIAEKFSYTEGWTEMSPSAKRMTDFSDAVGFWKAVMLSDPENETEDGAFNDYFNVEISGSADDTFVTFNWNRRVTESTGEVLDLKSNSGYSGTFSNGSITAENNGTVTITDFWSDNGTEYAVGKYTWHDGTAGYIGLIRTK